MSHIVLVGAHPGSLTNFRGDFIRALKSAGHRITAMSASASDEQIARLAYLGADFRPYPVERNGLNPLRDMETLISLIGIFKEVKPDVIIAYTIKPVIWSGMALRFLPSRVSYFAMITGLGYAFHTKGFSGFMLSKSVSLLYSIALRRARGVIFQNVESRGLFVERHIVPGTCSHIVSGSGVNLEQFAHQPMPDRKYPVFLLVARLIREKGIREYAEAARIVKQNYPKAVFRLLGPSDPSPDGISMQEIEQWQREGSVEYLGRTDDVRPFLADCNIFVLPSYYGEGLSRSILEAMASGRPILTTDNPGCYETVVIGENGFVVPGKDSAALAERMVWFIENPERCLKMGARSRQIAAERYDVHRINRQLMAITEL